MGVVMLAAPSAHPNEFYRRRIERALEARKRYKYVAPKVVSVPDGYRIESPCCSRKVDPEGGVIDIALLACDSRTGYWALSRKEHQSGLWREERRFQRLSDLLDHLNLDPEHKFWQ